jgi:hypothetical protein
VAQWLPPLPLLSRSLLPCSFYTMDYINAGGNCAYWLSLSCDTLPCSDRCLRSWPQGIPAPKALTRPILPWLCSLCYSSSSFALSSGQWSSQMPSLQTCQPTWLPLPAPPLQTLVVLHSFRSVAAPSAVHLYQDVRLNCFQPKCVTKSVHSYHIDTAIVYVCCTCTMCLCYQGAVNSSAASSTRSGVCCCPCIRLETVLMER